MSNLNAVAVWVRSNRVRGEPIDGLAVTLARTGAEALINHPATCAAASDVPDASAYPPGGVRCAARWLSTWTSAW